MPWTKTLYDYLLSVERTGLFNDWPRNTSFGVAVNVADSTKLHRFPAYDYFSYILRDFPLCESGTDYVALPRAT